MPDKNKDLKHKDPTYNKKINKKNIKENNMDIMKRYKHGELSADVAKVKNEKLAIDPNSKVTKGSTAGDSNDKPGAKSKVDPSIFRMAEERDY